MGPMRLQYRDWWSCEYGTTRLAKSGSKLFGLRRIYRCLVERSVDELVAPHAGAVDDSFGMGDHSLENEQQDVVADIYREPSAHGHETPGASSHLATVRGRALSWPQAAIVSALVAMTLENLASGHRAVLRAQHARCALSCRRHFRQSPALSGRQWMPDPSR